MSKGFDQSKEKDLGYILLLLPDLNAYAASFRLGNNGEKFIGVTNNLESVQIWKNIQGAREGVYLYIDLLMDCLENKSTTEVIIRKLKRLSKNKFKQEYAETLSIEMINKKKDT